MGRVVLALLTLGCYDPSPACEGACLSADGADGGDDGGPPIGCPAAPVGCEAFTCQALDSCYLECPPNVTFDDSNTRCIGWGGAETATLVVIDTAEENRCVFDHIKVAGATNWWHGYWIGFRQASNQPDPAAGWSWLYPNTSGFLNWYDGSDAIQYQAEPNDDGGPEDCAFMFRYDMLGGTWADAGCSQDGKTTTAGLICEVHR